MQPSALPRLLCGLLLSCAPALQAQTAAIAILPAGHQPTAVDASHFTGNARVESRFRQTTPAHLGGGLVSFEPGARTDWHSHPLGQTLFVSAGEGWVQLWGGPVQTMRQGDVVLIPPGVKHWHGASAQHAMSHFAVSEALDGNTVTWMEPVSDEQYLAK